MGSFRIQPPRRDPPQGRSRRDRIPAPSRTLVRDRGIDHDQENEGDVRGKSGVEGESPTSRIAPSCRGSAPFNPVAFREEPGYPYRLKWRSVGQTTAFSPGLKRVAQGPPQRGRPFFVSLVENPWRYRAHFSRGRGCVGSAGRPDARCGSAVDLAEPVDEETQRRRRPSAAPTRRAGTICVASRRRAPSSCLSADTTVGALLALLASRPGATPCPTEMSS
jgi:hypothetical protein